MAESVYEFNVKDIKGNTVNLSQYKGKTLLIVNVASRCGLTPQYAGLEELQKKYSSQNFTVLGFPCNQFGMQEPEGEAEIAKFCDLNFKVSFPMFSKIDVNGKNTAPLFDYLKSNARGRLWLKPITWNFTKFLVGPDGKVIKRYNPEATPQSFEDEIEKALESSN